MHGNIPALVEIWMQGSCKKPLRLPKYLADDAGDLRSSTPAQGIIQQVSQESVPMPICSGGITGQITVFPMA